MKNYRYGRRRSIPKRTPASSTVPETNSSALQNVASAEQKKKDMAKIYNITRITKDKIQYFEILMSSDDSFRPSGRAAAWNVSEA